MEKRNFLKSARTKTIDSHNSIDSIGSINCIDSIGSIESEDSTDSIDSIDFIGSIDSILVPHKRPPTFTPHTKGKTTVSVGRARSAQPLCVWCECWRCFESHHTSLINKIFKVVNLKTTNLGKVEQL